MSQYKDIHSLDDLKDDMEHYITHDVDQMESKVAKPETPEYSEEELAKFTKDQIEHDEETLRRERGLEEQQLKETIKKIIAKVITE